MTMTQPEKLGVLADWARAINETNARIDDLHKITGMCDGPLIESIKRLRKWSIRPSRRALPLN